MRKQTIREILNGMKNKLERLREQYKITHSRNAESIYAKRREIRGIKHGIINTARNEKVIAVNAGRIFPGGK